MEIYWNKNMNNKNELSYTNILFIIFIISSIIFFVINLLIDKVSIYNNFMNIFIPISIIGLFVVIINKYNKKWFRIISNIIFLIYIIFMLFYYTINTLLQLAL